MHWVEGVMGVSMNYTWNEIRLRAAAFVSEWSGESKERSEAQSFYNDFFDIFGVKRRSVARYEEHVRKLGDRSGFIDLFWPGVLIAEHKSLGRDLEEASDQASEYFDDLPEPERPRFRLVCDFQNFVLSDLDTGEVAEFSLDELPDHIELFSFIVGKQRPTHRVSQPLNDKAASYVAGLHKALVESGYPKDDAEKLAVRLVFCMFADVTSIFQPRGIFLDLIDSKTADDGAGVGAVLARLFDVLNRPIEERQETTDPDFMQFPYINGSLFEERIAIVADSPKLRKLLIEAAQFDWSTVSPAIFGALFQGVLTPSERLLLGGHSTSEENILRVLEDLFLADFRVQVEELEKAGASRVARIRELWDRFAAIRILDPACGCGNFLAVTYRELRRLELRLVKALIACGGLDPASEEISKIDVDQFFGIDMRTSSARIAEISMWMTDHTMNNEFSMTLGVVFNRIPLKAAPKIQLGDALALDWADVLPSDQCSYIIANPPYKGSKKQTRAERRQVRGLGGGARTGGVLDYAAGWLFKAGAYAHEGTKIAFVTTNSLVQGEQIAGWYPILNQDYKLEIIFAHRPFSWDGTGSGAAQVDVIVLGFSKIKAAPDLKRLYYYNSNSNRPTGLTTSKLISPYLLPANNLRNPRVVVKSSRKVINGASKLITGSKPIDGGYFILSESERDVLLSKNPEASTYIRPFMGADEFLYGTTRYIIYFGDDPSAEYRNIKPLMSILKLVRDYRLGEIYNKAESKKLTSPNKLAASPTQWHITTVPDDDFLIIPEVSSENREYIPIGWVTPPTIPSNLVKVLKGASLFDFGLLTSAMHMAWVRLVGGRLEGRYRYSIGIIYNNFPRPRCSESEKSRIAALAQGILDARSASRMPTLEAMYDPVTMPKELRSAHNRLDSAVDRLYRKEPFGAEQDRWEFLLNQYASLCLAG